MTNTYLANRHSFSIAVEADAAFYITSIYYDTQIDLLQYMLDELNTEEKILTVLMDVRKADFVDGRILPLERRNNIITSRNIHIMAMYMFRHGKWHRLDSGDYRTAPPLVLFTKEELQEYLENFSYEDPIHVSSQRTYAHLKHKLPIGTVLEIQPEISSEAGSIVWIEEIALGKATVRHLFHWYPQKDLYEFSTRWHDFTSLRGRLINRYWLPNRTTPGWRNEWQY